MRNRAIQLPVRMSSSGVTSILTEDLAFELDESLVRQVIDRRDRLSWAHVIGEVLKSRDEAGRLRIKVVELKHRHGY